MKRVGMLIVFALVFVGIVSGFKHVDKQAVDLRDCTLHNEQVNLHIFPGNHYQANTVSLRVSVKNGVDMAAIGSRRVELLQIPGEGISFRIPLSKRLESHKKYEVAVEIDSNCADGQKITWSDVNIVGIGSNGFFEKNFKAITEPSELRNQIRVAGIRQVIR